MQSPTRPQEVKDIEDHDRIPTLLAGGRPVRHDDLEAQLILGEAGAFGSDAGVGDLAIIDVDPEDLPPRCVECGEKAEQPVTAADLEDRR